MIAFDMERLITAILIEDDSQARSILQKFLEIDEEVLVVASLENTLNAEEIVLKLNPDVVFLDIHLPYESGIKFATRLIENGNETLLVFTTAFQSYALEAFSLKPFDFLVKPFGLSEISDLLIKIKRHFGTLEISSGSVSAIEYPAKVQFKTNQGFLFVVPQEVLYVKSSKNCCELFLTSGKIEKVLSPISAISKEFAGSNFRMINRSILINMGYSFRIDRKLKKCVVSSPKCEFELPINQNNYNFFMNFNSLNLG